MEIHHYKGVENHTESLLPTLNSQETSITVLIFSGVHSYTMKKICFVCISHPHPHLFLCLKDQVALTTETYFLTVQEAGSLRIRSMYGLLQDSSESHSLAHKESSLA